jgi:hypothetical protein
MFDLNFHRFVQAILTGFNALLAKYPAEQQAEVWRAIGILPSSLLRLVVDAGRRMK